MAVRGSEATKVIASLGRKKKERQKRNAIKRVSQELKKEEEASRGM